jgi:hypothetical protein
LRPPRGWRFLPEAEVVVVVVVVVVVEAVEAVEAVVEAASRRS